MFCRWAQWTCFCFSSEFSHCDDYEGSFHQDYSTRNIGPSLVDFRDMTTGDSVSDDITMYPFHAELVPPYTESMAPKVRADDVVTIITNKELSYRKSFQLNRASWSSELRV